MRLRKSGMSAVEEVTPQDMMRMSVYDMDDSQKIEYLTEVLSNLIEHLHEMPVEDVIDITQTGGLYHEPN